ncbi:hypothetical protein A3Q56_06653 [Intoshia linei]|uniref:Uncharacterized protein n=1 Tax=Intoshia linei TaxID=1819745 RepID=A0A177AUY6_9BILA|nr:hypothetical protein A3Q56_06653 [Intoshia linei]
MPKISKMVDNCLHLKEFIDFEDHLYCTSHDWRNENINNYIID